MCEAYIISSLIPEPLHFYRLYEVTTRFLRAMSQHDDVAQWMHEAIVSEMSWHRIKAELMN